MNVAVREKCMIAVVVWMVQYGIGMETNKMWESEVFIPNPRQAYTTDDPG